MTAQQKVKQTINLFYYYWAKFRNVDVKNDVPQTVANGKKQAAKDKVFVYGEKIWNSITHRDGQAIDVTSTRPNLKAHQLLYDFYERYKYANGIRLGIGLNHVHFDTLIELANLPSGGNGSSRGAKFWLEEKIKGRLTIHKGKHYERNYKRIIATFLGTSTKNKKIKNKDGVQITSNTNFSSSIIMLAIVGTVFMVYKRQVDGGQQWTS